MKRDPARLNERAYDLIVIGGGIHGVWAAWDAALRGLSVALLDQGDFGGATSANSLRIVHGGLRYLQHGDLRLVRQSSREQLTLLRLAPHLVRPLPVLLPTRRRGLHTKRVLSLALRIHALLGSGRRASAGDTGPLPPPRTVTREECLRLCPWVDDADLTGGVLWHDGQFTNPDRLLLGILRSAVDLGVDAANHLAASGFLLEAGRVVGVRGRDALTGTELEVRGRVVLNAAGPWANTLVASLRGRPLERLGRLSKGINLVVRPLLRDVAVAVAGPARVRDGKAGWRGGRRRAYFICPWRDVSLVGTAHLPFDGDPARCRVDEREIRDFLLEVRRACPALRLEREDVQFFHVGALPAAGQGPGEGEVRLLRRHRVHDHRREGFEGLISLVGVKYTTARGVAQEAVDLVLRHLGRPAVPCRTAVTPFHGATEDPASALERAVSGAPSGVPVETVARLVRERGAASSEILRYADADRAWLTPVVVERHVVRAEVVHAVREEMACKLADVVFRRTVMGVAGDPGAAELEGAARLMAQELRWGEARTARELEEVRSLFRPEAE